MALLYFLISSSLASYHVKKGENYREIYVSSSFLSSQFFLCLVYFGIKFELYGM